MKYNVFPGISSISDIIVEIQNFSGLYQSLNLRQSMHSVEISATRFSEISKYDEKVPRDLNIFQALL